MLMAYQFRLVFIAPLCAVILGKVVGVSFFSCPRLHKAAEPWLAHYSVRMITLKHL